jgi:hypothetical protein
LVSNNWINLINSENSLLLYNTKVHLYKSYDEDFDAIDGKRGKVLFLIFIYVAYNWFL